MGADYSFYVKSIAIYAPTFWGYNNSVLAIVEDMNQYGNFDLVLLFISLNYVLLLAIFL